MTEPRVIETQRQVLVEIVIVENTWPTQSCAKVCVEVVEAPKCPLSAFEINVVGFVGGITASPAVDTEGQRQAYRCAEQSPAMIKSRVYHEIEALGESCLNACETNSSLFSRKLFLGCSIVSRAVELRWLGNSRRSNGGL